MRIIKRFPNGEVLAEPEKAREALAEVGDIIELDYQDYTVISVDHGERRPLYRCTKF